MTATMKTPPRENATAEAPRSAFGLTCGPMTFVDGHDDADIRPFRMVARSPEAIDHWYWGRIVHDLDGMQLRKSSCPVDYRHDEAEELGFADNFDITDNGLEVAGSLVILEPNDRADKVFKRGKAGIPYESSIDWIGHDTELEWIPEDVSAEVNGRQFEGPGYVVRKWPLRSVAICPYGADSGTSTKFSDADSDAVSVRVFTSSEKENQAMAKTATVDPVDVPDTAKQQAETPTPEAKAPAANSITPDTLKQFNDAFGAKAMEYLTAGLTFDAAKLQFADHRIAEADAKAKQFEEERDAANAALEDATEKLKQFGNDLGQSDPLHTDSGEGGQRSETVETIRRMRAKRFGI